MAADPLLHLLARFGEEGVAYVLVGGQAVRLNGFVRATEDVDVLVRSGDDWKCERGFARVDGRCDPIVVPANAYLDDVGSEWRCDRGFRKEGAGCTAVRVPDGGYINYSGDDWSCADGFLKKDGACLTAQTQ